MEADPFRDVRYVQSLLLPVVIISSSMWLPPEKLTLTDGQELVAYVVG